MPKAAFGFDGDNAAYEALRAKVLEDEKKARENNAAGEVSDGTKRRKSTFGEKVANVLFNGGRPDDVEGWRDLKGKVRPQKPEQSKS